MTSVLIAGLLALFFLSSSFLSTPVSAQSTKLEPRGAELKDGTWVMSVGAGLGYPMGSTRMHFGIPYAVGGEAYYVPRPEYALGLQVDRLLFMGGQGGGSSDATVITLVDRANAAMGWEKTLLYALIGLGFAEVHASLPDGGLQHGAGPALALGVGVQSVYEGALGWAVEGRLLRASAGLPKLGMGGITVVVAQVKVNWKFTWAPSFFGQ